MLRALVFWLIIAFTGGVAFDARAGGSGLNVAIIVNQNSTNSVQAGNYYRTLRNIPPQNYFRINWAGTNISWNASDFTNSLLNPFLSALSSRGLTNQIDYVVLSMDIPYRVMFTNSQETSYNSTTSALFYGYKHYTNAECELADGSSNAYAASESIFRRTPPISGLSNFFMVTMITATNLAMAETELSQGASGDYSFSTNTVWLCKGSIEAYTVRYLEYDNAVFNTRLRGNYSVARTNSNGLYFSPYSLGAQAGSPFVGGTPPLFVPGAIVDDLTSFGGQFLENSGQTTVLSYFNLGACASYGTVSEPCNYLEKFPDSQNYFYQSRGFSAGECYYQSVTNIYQGLVCGEPLAQPFAQPGTGAWNALSSNSILSGMTNLSGQFSESDAHHPMQQVDLFVDGCWIATITNVAPQAGNALNVSINGYATSYTVPANATLNSIASNLVTTLNGVIYQNNTKVLAMDHGDRVELQSLDSFTKLGTQIPISVSSATSSGPLTTFICTANGAPTNFLDSTAQGIQYYDVTGTPTSLSMLTCTVTKTNGTIITVTVTNSSNGSLDAFVQQFATAINGKASLQGADGLFADDVQLASGTEEVFNLQPQSSGYAAAQIKATITSADLVILPAGANTLTANTSDLEPRQHLYITAGVSNLAFTLPFVTTNYTDGHHELVAVAYEGSSVHTQTRATQDIIIKNTSLSATLTPMLTGSVTNLQPTLQITVAANTNNISSIQLFSTGGLLASATNQNSATFTITLTNLNIGTHPLYAIVTQSNGHQYRTQTDCIGLMGVTYSNQTLMGVDYPFPLTVAGRPVQLVWPATAGRSYSILSTTNLLSSFQVRATVVPTNSLGQWTETNSVPAKQFYSVSVSP